MKTKLTFAIALCCTISSLFGQITQSCFTENFNSQTTGWTYSQGASEGAYNSPAVACSNDRGIVTPGVGGNNPANIKTPNFTSTGALTVQLAFDIFCVDANLSCSSWRDFGCPTSIDVFYYIGATKYVAITDLVLPANGPLNSPTVSFSFSAGNNLPAGTVYRVELAFKPKSGIGNCGQPGTKYILDNFKKCEISCADCTIDAINDNFCLLPNISETVTGDLSTNDFKYSGANVTYSLANGPFANGNSVRGGANLTINANGSFSITRTDLSKTIFDFTYKVTDNVLNFSDLASVTVCFPLAGPLPLILTDFYATRKGISANLNWKTSYEYNSLGFEVEKFQDNKFVTVGTVAARNNINGAAYTFSEMNNAVTATQYRLKMIDKDQKFVYSEIKTIKGLGAASEYSVFPNPSQGAVKVSINDITGSEKIQVVDNMGRIVKSVPNAQDAINISGLQKGVYFLKITNPVTGIMVTKKLIVN